MSSIQQHQDEILKNQQYWQKKPVLQQIYRDFHKEIASHLSSLEDRNIIELGSGIGNIKDVIPDCLRTDLFPNPWIDQVENAYALTFEGESISDLILFDVFHHLRHPGTALDEFWRVLQPGGRVLVFDPYISLLGWVVYGALHAEPVGWRNNILWNAPEGWSPHQVDYYAAQGNVTKVFFWKPGIQPNRFRVIGRFRYAALSYALSGGYSGPQLYPTALYPVIRQLDKLFDLFPGLFATRSLVVLEKAP